jgi:hypothetical protein
MQSRKTEQENKGLEGKNYKKGSDSGAILMKRFRVSGEGLEGKMERVTDPKTLLENERETYTSSEESRVIL